MNLAFRAIYSSGKTGVNQELEHYVLVSPLGISPQRIHKVVDHVAMRIFLPSAQRIGLE